MAIVNISLPEQLKQYIDERLTDGRFSSTSEYFRDLIRKDQMQRAQQRLEALLLVGLESGGPTEVTDDYLQQKRSELSRRIERDSNRGL